MLRAAAKNARKNKFQSRRKEASDCCYSYRCACVCVCVREGKNSRRTRKFITLNRSTHCFEAGAKISAKHTARNKLDLNFRCEQTRIVDIGKHTLNHSRSAWQCEKLKWIINFFLAVFLSFYQNQQRRLHGWDLSKIVAFFTPKQHPRNSTHTHLTYSKEKRIAISALEATLAENSHFVFRVDVVNRARHITYCLALTV